MAIVRLNLLRSILPGLLQRAGRVVAIEEPSQCLVIEEIRIFAAGGSLGVRVYFDHSSASGISRPMWASACAARSIRRHPWAAA